MLIGAILTLMISFLASLVSTYTVAGFLEDNGKKINYWNIRGEFFHYLLEYRNISRSINGKTGIYFYIFLFSTFMGVASFACCVYLVFGGAA